MDESARATTALAKGTSRKSLPAQKILLVEDEAVTAMDLKSNLIRLGYQVPAVVASGEEAVSQAAELRPDLVLMDITLKGPMSAIQAAETIRQTLHIPIIYLTAHTDTETLGRAKLTEPFGYLPKPCGLNTLGPTIEMALFKNEADSERRKIEEALRQSVNKYRTVADFTHDWEFWIAPDENIIYCSPSCARITGYPATAFQEDPALLRRLVLAEDLAQYDQHRHQCTQGRMDCSDFEFRITRSDGAMRWIAHACQPVFDSAGVFIGTRGSNRDITNRKRLEAEATKSRNLESLGILAGGIAHDFNNLFQGLLGNISLAKMSLPESHEAYQFLQNAEQVYASAAKLTGQLLAFSSGGISLRKDIDPGAFIREAASAELSGAGLTAEFDLPENLARINVDPIQFRQVIKHLLVNSIEAMPTGGKIRVSAANLNLGPDSSTATALAPGNYLKLSIEDQGCGIGQDDLPRIFDPYFSTKQRGVQKGMGLGLSLCNTIIQKHGGGITVESEQGRGATFHVFLPSITTDLRPATMSQEIGGHGPRILIMDDDPGVLQVATKFLHSFGYRVDSAMHGTATINAYQEASAAGDPYAVVILDLNVPSGMGGLETIAILKEFDPQVKAIVSSGYVNDPAMTDFAAHGFAAAFEKPYQLTKLTALLEQLLAAPGRGNSQ